MGRAIFYCGTCSTRVYEEAILQGLAFKHGDRVLCAACAPSVGITPPPSTRKVKPASSTAVRRLQASTPKLPVPAVPSEEVEGAPPRRRMLLPLLAGGAAVLGVLGLAAFLVFGGGEKTPSPEPAPTSDLKSPDAGPPDATENRTARPPAPPRPEVQALEQARRYARQNPDDLEGQVREFDKVRWKFEASREAQEALLEVEAVRAKLKEVVEKALADLEKDVRAPLDRKDYAEAIRLLEAAQPRLKTPEWGLALGRRLREVREAKGRAEESATPEKPAPPPVADAKPAAPPLPAETKPRTEEGKAYLARWEQSAARAAARDFAGALGDLERGASGLKEDDCRRELAQDAEDVRKLETLYRQLLESASATPRGRALALETRSGTKGSGAVLLSDAYRVELSQGPRKPSAFVEWSDVTAASLAAAARTVKPDARSLALLLLVEGDVEAARVALGGKLDAVPAKYWGSAAGARARVPAPERRELDARELFYAAEREFRSMETRGQACEKYKTLQNDFAAAAVVRSAAERIVRRGDACRDYFLAGSDLRWEGAFRLRKDGRLESQEEMDVVYANRNWVEAEFYALPETPYRLWVLLGGCCQESFTFWLQGTELTDVDPKTRKKISVEPGGRFGSPGKQSIRGLKATHAACSPKKEPKQASRWEWVEIPLPKYAGPGVKRIRFLTNEKGFGVGGAVVSAVRKAPPNEAELRDLDRAREADVVPSAVDPDLVGHWTMDEGDGAAVGDATGNGLGGTVSGKPRWSEGKVGGALVLDGKESWVTVPDAPALRIKGDITVALWMRKDSDVNDWQRIVGKGDPTRRTYGVWTAQSDGGKILWQHYNDGGQPILNVNGGTALQAGRWYHVVCVVGGNQAAIYVDGKKDGEGTRNGEPAVSSDAPLTLGHAGHHAAFPGALDDVRIYRRALGVEEIQNLHSLGR